MQNYFSKEIYPGICYVDCMSFCFYYCRGAGMGVCPRSFGLLWVALICNSGYFMLNFDDKSAALQMEAVLSYVIVHILHLFEVL